MPLCYAMFYGVLQLVVVSPARVKGPLAMTPGGPCTLKGQLKLLQPILMLLSVVPAVLFAAEH